MHTHVHCQPCRLPTVCVALKAKIIATHPASRFRQVMVLGMLLMIFLNMDLLFCRTEVGDTCYAADGFVAYLDMHVRAMGQEQVDARAEFYKSHVVFD